MDKILKKLSDNKNKYGEWWLEDKSVLERGYKLSTSVLRHYLRIKYKLYIIN